MSRSEKNSKKPQEQEQGNITAKYGHTGDYLRRLREEKGLSIAEVCQFTRVSETNLKAIEEQNFAALPADTFTRGLLNIYAKFLDVDQADVVSKFMQERDESQLQGKRVRGKLPRSLLTPKTMAEPTHVSSMFMASIILLIVIVLFAGFCIYTSWNPFSFLVTEKYDLQSAITDVFPDSSSSPQAAEQSGSEAGVSAAAHDQSVLVIPSGTAGEMFRSPGAVTEAQAGANHTLTIRFLTDGVVTVTRDGEEPFIHVYMKGEEQSWNALSPATVTFDKPDCAALFVDNEPVDFPSAENGSITLRIPQDLPKTAAND